MFSELAEASCSIPADGFVADPQHPFVPPAFQRLRANRALSRRPMRSKPKIVHLIGALGSGGAERQLVNLVTALGKRGLDVSVLSMEPLIGPSAFRLPALQQNNIPARAVQRGIDPGYSALAVVPHIGDLIAQLPNWLKPWPLEIARELATDPPDILHIWLDFTNITGAIAALMLGVPRIILSTRSVNPTHFSYMNTPWFQPWYTFLATIPDLLLLNNSEAGQRDYAQWMNMPPTRFQVIRNGIDTAFYHRAEPEQIASLRQELQLQPGDQLLAGVFRLSEEKRPLLFLEVAQAVMQSRPHLHTAIFGHGPLESEVRTCIANSPLASRIHLVPPRDDMPVVYSASDLLLQTSILEGTPNTLLEAQATGCPVVTTAGGGAAECLLDQETGFIADTSADLTERVARILDDNDLRNRLSHRGRAFIEDRFNFEQMTDSCIDLYRA